MKYFIVMGYKDPLLTDSVSVTIVCDALRKLNITPIVRLATPSEIRRFLEMTNDIDQDSNPDPEYPINVSGVIKS